MISFGTTVKIVMIVTRLIYHPFRTVCAQFAKYLLGISTLVWIKRQSSRSTASFAVLSSYMDLPEQLCHLKCLNFFFIVQRVVLIAQLYLGISEFLINHITKLISCMYLLFVRISLLITVIYFNTSFSLFFLLKVAIKTS